MHRQPWDHKETEEDVRHSNQVSSLWAKANTEYFEPAGQLADMDECSEMQFDDRYRGQTQRRSMAPCSLGRGDKKKMLKKYSTSQASLLSENKRQTFEAASASSTDSRLIASKAQYQTQLRTHRGNRKDCVTSHASIDLSWHRDGHVK